MTDSDLSLIARKSLEYLKVEFPRASKEHCSNREGDACGITGERCEFETCPKVKKKIEERKG